LLPGPICRTRKTCDPPLPASTSTPDGSLRRQQHGERPAARIGWPMLTTILIIAAVIICLKLWLRRP
jgi:hypothetical protein